MMKTERVYWLAIIIVCFIVVSGDDFLRGTDKTSIPMPTCHQLCQELDIGDGCQYAPKEVPKEEVIVMTNGSPTISAWKWDTISMVVSTYFDGVTSTGRAACLAHSKGKRYGLQERVPGSEDINSILGDVKSVIDTFNRNITHRQQLLMADHMVFDLVPFFRNVDSLANATQRPLAISKMIDILSSASSTAQKNNDREVFCVVPWEPPCPEGDCVEIRHLLGSCHILLLSPDSYMPVHGPDGKCRAQATVPISKFLYGLDRYIALRAQPNVLESIVAGIPWHGYTYKCEELKDDKCTVQQATDKRCFDNSNRQRKALSEIHNMPIPGIRVKMEEVSKGIYYNLNNTAQMWYENFTTLYIKYHLVQDLKLRGLSIWYGEDLVFELSTDQYTLYSWDFLTHQVLHSAASSPVKSNHVHADTVAGIGIGCLLLGTALGVGFTFIALRQRTHYRRNRPFKLDETDDDFRDDEGL